MDNRKLEETRLKLEKLFEELHTFLKPFKQIDTNMCQNKVDTNLNENFVDDFALNYRNKYQ